jgi:hypothetical protein
MYSTYVKIIILADFPDIVCSSGFLHHQCNVPNFDIGTLRFLPALYTDHGQGLLANLCYNPIEVICCKIGWA